MTLRRSRQVKYRSRDSQHFWRFCLDGSASVLSLRENHPMVGDDGKLLGKPFRGAHFRDYTSRVLSHHKSQSLPLTGNLTEEIYRYLFCVLSNNITLSKVRCERNTFVMSPRADGFYDFLMRSLWLAWEIPAKIRPSATPVSPNQRLLQLLPGISFPLNSPGGTKLFCLTRAS